MALMKMVVCSRSSLESQSFFCKPGSLGPVLSKYKHFALHPQKRGGLLGTGTGVEGGKRVKARPRAPTRKTMMMMMS